MNFWSQSHLKMLPQPSGPKNFQNVYKWVSLTNSERGPSFYWPLVLWEETWSSYNGFLDELHYSAWSMPEHLLPFSKDLVGLVILVYLSYFPVFLFFPVCGPSLGPLVEETSRAHFDPGGPSPSCSSSCHLPVPSCPGSKLPAATCTWIQLPGNTHLLIHASHPSTNL